MSRIFLLTVLTLIVLGVSAIVALRYSARETLAAAASTPRFVEAPLPRAHLADLRRSLPFAGAAVFDFDGDGDDDLFLGGGRDQDDAVFAFRGNRFEPVATSAKQAPDATLGAAAIDLDADGRDELFLARESGVWLCRRLDTTLSCRNLEMPIDATTTPLSIALADVNADEMVDLYVSGYIRKELVDGETVFRRPYGGYSYLFLGEGERRWRDATEEYGLRRQHNTFTALFADLDNDSDSDLVIAQDTGRVEMHENRGAPPFVAIENPSVFSYPMGIGAGDLGNDGLIDLHFSNVGHTLPAFMLRGDLEASDPFNPDYMLFHNGGQLHFEDRASDAGLARLGFGWGVVFADMNLDGRQDILAAQNYARLPTNALTDRYPGKLLLQQADGSFASAETLAGVENPHFGVTPIVADFNGDARPDLVWVNVNGPARAFLNRGPVGHGISVRLPNTAAYLNARIEVRIGAQRRFGQVIANQGLGADQSRTQFFGLGEADQAERVIVSRRDGRTMEFTDVRAGSVLRVGAVP